MRSDNLANERIGKIGINKYGSIMKIVDYTNNNDMYIKFEQGEPVHTTWNNFCKGTVRYDYDKSIYGLGFLGKGIYKSTINGIHTTVYTIWQQMLRRCYDEKQREKFSSYDGCTVIEEWHNFQNFAAWYDENYYELDNERNHLDKDILVKGNKIYSPEMCVFAPQKINSLFTKANSNRGALPIGVNIHKPTNKYRGTCRNGEIRYTESFKTPEEAFQFYKFHKEKYIKQIAEKYKNQIPSKLYEAMLEYEVEITD